MPGSVSINTYLTPDTPNTVEEISTIARVQTNQHFQIEIDLSSRNLVVSLQKNRISYCIIIWTV